MSRGLKSLVAVAAVVLLVVLGTRLLGDDDSPPDTPASEAMMICSNPSAKGASDTGLSSGVSCLIIHGMISSNRLCLRYHLLKCIRKHTSAP